MEEKERYEIRHEDDGFDINNDFINYIVDTKTGEYMTDLKICDLLNQQSKYIEELKEINEKLDKRAFKNFDAYMRCSKKYTQLVEENQQLKQAQKQLAISELEKVKEYNHTLSLGGSPYIDVFINNQIKELGGEENE